jgi:Tat protein translocase TatB subunit
VLNVGTPELLVILLVALLVLGPDRLPGAARQVGKVMGDLRRMSSGFQKELRDAMKEGERAVGLAPDQSKPFLGDAPPLAPTPFPADPAAPEGNHGVGNGPDDAAGPKRA